jgi:hypothetical protein
MTGSRTLSAPTGLDLPLPRYAPAMAYDAARRQVVLFGGGLEDGSEADDLWIWDGVAWEQVFPPLRPPPRLQAQMAYDPVRRELVLFGGVQTDPFVQLDDTWTWNGIEWTPESPTVSPSESSGGMAFDTDGREMVLLAPMPFGDPMETWTWNGADWMKVSPATSPPERHFPGMAFDWKRREIVVFGGYYGCVEFDCIYRRDTWTWNDRTWSEETPPRKPSPRSSMGMQHAQPPGKVVLFGGFGEVPEGFESFLGDTWLWDGSTWAPRQFPQAPMRRSQMGMAYDFARHQTVLFGGSTRDGVIGDTWVLDDRGWQCAVGCS